MDYALGIEGAPETVPGGSGVLLVHPSTVETDSFDTQFLAGNGDPALIVSTHSAAREVRQKLEHFGVDPERAEILDTISVERGYTRRQREDVTYLTAPDDLDGIVGHVEAFLERHDGPRRLTLDSVTELIYYADGPRVRETVRDLLDLLEAHDAVGLFHVAAGVDDETVEAVRGAFAGVVSVDEDGTVTASFDET